MPSTVSRRAVLKGALGAGVAVAVSGIASTAARADQPRMEAALEALKDAKRKLENAGEDKGGFRQRAINSVERAIEQVEKGIAWDKNHEGKKEGNKNDGENEKRGGRGNKRKDVTPVQ